MKGPRLAAEALGTFMLVFIGAGAVVVNTWAPGSVSNVGVSLAFGFVILAAVYALGHISGAHFNPALTTGFWLSGRFPAADVLPYVGAQVFGATVAALLLRLFLGGAARAAATVPALEVWRACGVEAVLTFLLMLVVMAVATDARVASPAAGLAVGLTIAFDALMGGPLTGASMNPARSLGPAIVAGVWRAQWIYWVGPLAGAAAAVHLYEYLRKGKAHDYRTRKA